MTIDTLALALAALEDDAKATELAAALTTDRNMNTASAAASHQNRYRVRAAFREPALAREVIRLSKELEYAISENFAFNVRVATEINEARQQRDQLRAELERVTPIVDAAKNWRPQVGECRPLPDGRACECEDCWLIRAIDDAAAKETK